MDDFCAPESSYELGVQNGYERAGCLTLKLAKDMPVVGCEIVTCTTWFGSKFESVPLRFYAIHRRGWKLRTLPDRH